MPLFNRLLLFVLLLLPGCSVGPGGQLSFFPRGHRLLPEAKELRQLPPTELGVPRELQKQPLPPYIVEPGDVLLLQPADLDSSVRLPGDQNVLTDGTISLGRYGPLLVAGKTVEQIQAEAQHLIRTQGQEVGPLVARVVVRQSKVFYVLGEVNAPGSFPCVGRETVLDAILAAGGLNDRASRSNIVLSRPSPPESCRVVLPVCYDRIVQLGETSTNYQIAPGDRIFVPTRCAGDDPCKSKKWSCPFPLFQSSLPPSSQERAPLPEPQPLRELAPPPRREMESSLPNLQPGA